MRRSRHLLAALGAGLMALALVVEPALGTSFAGPMTISSDGSVTSPGALAVTGSSSAILAFEALAPGAVNGERAVYVRRTANGGSSWTSRVRVSTYGDDISEWGTGYASPIYVAGRPSLAASGQHVSLVFQEQYDLTPYYGIRYLGSTNGGRTWHEAGSFTVADDRPMSPSVARTTSTVAVAWTDGDTGAIRVAVSAHGDDEIFRTPVTLGPTTSTPWTDRWDPDGLGTYSYDGEPVVAIGSGVMYVAWNSGGRILVRRSVDGGKTWKAAVSLTNTAGEAGPTMAANGTSLIVGFITDTGYPSIRRSTTSGSTWKARQSLSASSLDARSILVSQTGSSWIATFERCLTSSCASSAVFERRSTSLGASWTTETRMSPTFSGRVAVAGSGMEGTHVLVMYARHNTSSEAVYTRRS